MVHQILGSLMGIIFPVMFEILLRRPDAVIKIYMIIENIYKERIKWKSNFVSKVDAIILVCCK